MEPATGERWLRYVGDRIRVVLRRADGGKLPEGWTGLARTNIGRGALLRQEIIRWRGGERPFQGGSWRDVGMRREGDEWVVEWTLTEVGFFKVKAYAVDDRGWQVWPEGPDFGVTVHPDAYRTGNTIYCAFTRLFGGGREGMGMVDRKLEARVRRLEGEGYTVLPPSGKLRDVTRVLGHVVDELGCRIVHLLPVNPTPTTYGRFGRMGSPYAGLDLTAVDPALIEFDRRTTGVEQFCELAWAVHERGARLFLDLVVNHTGWSSTLQERHPDWFVRMPDGKFESPGAWGVVWEDLIDLDEVKRAVWDEVAEAFLTWCGRGVDGFRCDAGYKIPMPVWRHVIARVREEYPGALFLLEGLGGAWELTEGLLTEGGMQWAYSELFQEYSGMQVSGYLDHALNQSGRVGTLVHYSETHDNERLAKKGRAWSLMRNRLCGLTSASGGYGFTCGVEWLAKERIRVHELTGLAWGNGENLVRELSHLNRLLAGHPCFFDGARLTRLSAPGLAVYALRRDSASGEDVVLVLVNTDVEKARSFVLTPGEVKALEVQGGGKGMDSWVDLLGQEVVAGRLGVAGGYEFMMPAGGAYCLAAQIEPRGVAGEVYRGGRALAAWAVQALGEVLEPEWMGRYDWRRLGEMAGEDPEGFLGALGLLDQAAAGEDLCSAVAAARARGGYRSVVVWEKEDARRITVVPTGHWVLVRDEHPFRVCLARSDGRRRHAESVVVRGGHAAWFGPRLEAGDMELRMERFGGGARHVKGELKIVAVLPRCGGTRRSEMVLLTNGIGGMARMAVDLGKVTSKYDCVLGANLDGSVPVDRHVMAKRVRVWANANGFISALDGNNLADFDGETMGRWRFEANAGDGRVVEVTLCATMVQGKNTTVLRFERRRVGGETDTLGLRLTVRMDVEDRSFHAETRRNEGAERHFAGHARPLEGQIGFHFAPASDRQLRVYVDGGAYHVAPEWCEAISHPVEASRGQVSQGDAFSPGWFDLPLEAGGILHLVVTAEGEEDVGLSGLWSEDVGMVERMALTGVAMGNAAEERFAGVLRRAMDAYVVRRGRGKTVIAGYPWFLDWGRDTLICGRGLLAAGLTEEVGQLLATFGRLEEGGTLPNSIHGHDASNRDTTDAPLWYGLLSEEYGERRGVSLDEVEVDGGGRTVAEVLGSIAGHYVRGTANGIRMDEESGLIWSPAHFTWMDTNHPACTPREGYPIEIQALWIRLLWHVERLGVKPVAESWGGLARRAEESMERLFWLEDRGWLADVLVAKRGEAASLGVVDDALRSNQLLAVSLGVMSGGHARRCVEAARRHLVVPGGVRSLAPLPVGLPLEIRGADGRLLNEPVRPYWGRYEGDEDTRRKPAYHNGTAWVWMLPVFCEALVRAWEGEPKAVEAAKGYLLSLEELLWAGCAGQLPEVLDGDAPHSQRGCDAQAWSVTEALRVFKVVLSGGEISARGRWVRGVID
jgi:starch synthase (maltosyl-transferring)